MTVTIIAILMIMAGYFLLLYGADGFIQDKRFFGSAPKENPAVISKRKERFRGAHIIGWFIVAAALLLLAEAVALGIWDGVRNDFGFLKFFVRFLVMLYVMEIYDIVFFDWVLLCHSGFFPHFYPELKGVVGPHMFGYNQEGVFYYIHPRLRLACVGVYAHFSLIEQASERLLVRERMW